MLNRRHLRIKVLQAVYAYFQSEEVNLAKTEKELIASVERIYDLYLYLLLTFGEIKRLGVTRIEENTKKLMPTDEDLNPNTKFIDNKIIAQLEESKSLRFTSEDRVVNWVGDVEQEIFRKIFNGLKESENYTLHMNNNEVGYEEDRNFAINLFKSDIANSEILYSYFEEKNIFWIDDIDLACQMVIKTLKAAEENEDIVVLPLYKDKDDEQDFVRTLLRQTVNKQTETLGIIDKLTDNWELDRIAKMDILILQMAITELMVFKSIPTKVTLNEYIEIAKYYSTEKSPSFINGILDKAISSLTASGQISKMGKGLIN